MNKKLTLSIEQTAIQRGKRFAEKNGKSLSSMVEDFLMMLEPNDAYEDLIPVSNKLGSLVGIGAGPLDEDAYKDHLMEKYDR